MCDTFLSDGSVLSLSHMICTMFKGVLCNVTGHCSYAKQYMNLLISNYTGELWGYNFGRKTRSSHSFHTGPNNNRSSSQ